MSYPGLGFFSVPNLNPTVSKLEKGVAGAKTAVTKAQAIADANKIEKRHWDKLAKTEQGFQKALNTLDMIYPEHKRGKLDKLDKQIGMLALLAALALIGSTALLHVWVNR
jgi:hypothetical protein